MAIYRARQMPPVRILKGIAKFGGLKKIDAAITNDLNGFKYSGRFGLYPGYLKGAKV